MARTTGRPWAAVWLAAGLMAFAGCAAHPPAGASRPAGKGAAASTAPGEARTQVNRGPVQVTVVAAPAPARLSDELRLTLTVESEVGVEVENLPFGDALGDFLIRDYRDELPQLAGNRQVERHIYELEPTDVGPAHVDPIVVAFVDKRPRGDGKRHQLETEALTIDILSMVAEDAPQLADLKSFQAPLEVEGEGRSVWPAALALAGGAVLAAAAWWWTQRRRVAAAVVLSPRELAERELDSLQNSGMAEQDVKRFYVELTAIVRRYIEQTTGIRAPEQTTEEFLREVGGQDGIGRDDRLRLRDFLESADLVKFAAYQPRPEDSQQALARARAFVAAGRREQAA